MYIDEIPFLVVLLLAIYGGYSLIKNIVTRVKSRPANNLEREEGRRNLFNSLKIFFVGIIVAIIIYMTPVISETIKIIISLVVTVGTLGTAFLLNDEENKKSWLRPVLFMGQMFFGITMFLMLVNTNMGYSEFSIFLIWSIFNLFISKYFGNIENKILFVITTLITLILGISRYVVNLEAYVAVGIFCVLLLALQIFLDKEQTIVKIIRSTLITLLFFAYFMYLSNHYGGIVFADKVMLGITIVFLVVTFVIEGLVNGFREINFKGFAIYIPLIIAILLAGIKGNEEDFILVFGALNLTVATWLLANKTVYDKLLALVVLLLMTVALVSTTDLEPLNQLVIFASMGLTFVFLLEPKKQ